MRKNRKRKKASDPLRGLFRMKDYFSAVLEAWKLLRHHKGLGEDAAVALLLEALRKYARRPKPADLMEFAADFQRIQDPELSLVASMVSAYAINRWYRGVLEGMFLFVQAIMPVTMGADTDPVPGRLMRIYAVEFAYEYINAFPSQEPRLEPMKHVLRGALSTLLSQNSEPSLARRGRALIAEHLAEMRMAVDAAQQANTEADDLSTLRVELAKAIANQGQSLYEWAQRHDCDDPRARLEEALVLHNEALSIPERTQPENVVSHYHSLRMRGGCRRLLAAHIEDEARKLELLAGAVEDAQRAHALTSLAPSRFPDGRLIVVNIVNAQRDHLRLRWNRGELTPEAALSELGQIREVARTAGSDRGILDGPTLLAQMQSGLDDLEKLIQGAPESPTADQLIKNIVAAMATMRDPSRDFINPRAAEHVIFQLSQWPEQEPLPTKLLMILPGFFGGLSIDALGPRLSVMALMQESRILQKAMKPREGWDPARYIEEGLRGFHLRLANWSWAHAELRIASGWVRMLASHRLDLGDAHTSSLSVPARLRLMDLCGSMAWRADVGFYGAGLVQEGRLNTEAAWRCHLYRIRFERDRVAEVLQAEELCSLMSELTGSLIESPFGASHFFGNLYPPETPDEEIYAQSGVPPEQWQRTRDGTFVPQFLTPDRARARSTQLQDELNKAWGMGIGGGWAPREAPDVPEVVTDELSDWMSANPDLAVLAAGVGAKLWLTWAGAGGVQSVQIDGTESLQGLLTDYITAREAHSFGEQGTSNLDFSLSEEEITRRMHARIATPTATAELEKALSCLLAELGECLEDALASAQHQGVGRLLILSRTWARHIPWHGVAFDGALLGEAFACANIETLAPIPRAQPRSETTLLYVGGAAESGSPLALGSAVLSPLSDELLHPVTRNVLESHISAAGVVRFYAHGTAILMLSDGGGIELDEEHPIAANRLSISEARMLDLRGARRVELWACESGREDALYGLLLPHDEPGGMDAAVLLAGAECAISSLWIQYTLSAAMIAEAFTLEMRCRPQPEGEALGAAIQRYRQAVADGGVFAEAVKSTIASKRRVHVESVLRAGLDAWRAALWEELLEETPPPLPKRLTLAGARLGPVAAPARSSRVIAAEILASYRSPVAWAGWKVTLRSKEAWMPSQPRRGSS